MPVLVRSVVSVLLMSSRAGFAQVDRLTEVQSISDNGGAKEHLSAPRVVSNLTWVNFTESNPGSGPHPNQVGVTSQFDAGITVDLARMLHWSGASLNMHESVFAPKYNASLHFGSDPPASETGHYWDQDVGSTLVATTFQDFAPKSYLSRLTLSQRIGTRWDLTMGRLSPTLSFDKPDTCETALSCLDPITIYDNKTLPPALSTWGTEAALHFNPKNKLKVGLSQVDFNQLSSSGFDLSFRSGTGIFLAGEYAVGAASASTMSHAELILGAWDDTSTFSDPATGAKQRGSSATYARVESPAWALDDSHHGNNAGRYLTFFSTSSYSFSSAQPYRAFGNVGLNVHRIFAKRALDHYGLNVAYLRIRGHELDAERDFRKKMSGVVFRSSPDQLRVEGNAHLALLPGLSVEPSVAYIVHTNVQFPTNNGMYGVPKDGFVLGFLTFFDLRESIHPSKGKQP